MIIFHRTGFISSRSPLVIRNQHRAALRRSQQQQHSYFQNPNNNMITTTTRSFYHKTALHMSPLDLSFQYRGAIRRRLRQVKEESWIFGAGVTMERITEQQDTTKSTSGVFENLRLLQLNPEFKRRQEQEGWSLLSLGDYMASLRPSRLPKKMSMDDVPNLIQREIEAGLAAGLLKALGPNLGRALLPAVGIKPIQRKAQGIASSIATSYLMSEDGSMSESGDKAGIPVSVMTLLALADANAKLNSGNMEGMDEAVDDKKVPNFNLTAMEKMKAGEVVKGPSFIDPESSHLIPNKFVVSKHFDQAIQGMEERLGADKDPGGHDSTELKMAQETAMEYETGDTELPRQQYDPDDRRMGQPVRVNPRLFPDLHFGWGNALCSHTKREVLRMRLLALLLNKLGANYYRKVKGEDDHLFSVQMSENDEPITTPWEFVEALMDAGHDISVVPSSRLTTFGLGMCVKEKDGSWSNVPLGVFLESGYEDKDGNMAPVMLPHSGLDMHITGPLAGQRADGTPSKLALQHFIGIEGFCGWHSHANAEVPFNEAVPSNEPLNGKDNVARATRIAGLYGAVLNGLATELELPFGGYGLTAVCNDSAAIVQQCLYGENTIYPMTSIGRYMQRTMRYGQKFRDELQRLGGMDADVKDLNAIGNAMKKIPSDINAAPSNAGSAAKRLLHTLQPKMPFLLMNDSKKVMQSILKEMETEEDVAAGQKVFDNGRRV